jgi:signal transduction histidine kinase/ActR/RegA family two-component response regulator
VIAANLTAAVAFDDADTAGEVLGTLSNTSDTVFSRVLLPGGVEFARYSSQLANELPIPAAGKDPDFTGRRYLERLEAPIEVANSQLATLELWIDTWPVYRLGINILLFSIAALTFGLIFAYFMAARLGRNLLAPVRKLSQFLLETAGKEDYSARFNHTDIPEIQTVASSLNQMLMTIQDREQSLQQLINELELARDRAEQAAASKTAFLANMSHEIRTPMNGVVGMISVLKETDLTPRQATYFDTIERSASSLLLVIDDILDFTKLEAGKLRVTKEAFSLSAVVTEVATFFGRAASDKGLGFNTAISEQLRDSVLGDSARIRQILINLVGNAIKFTPRGSVELRVSPAEGSGSNMVRFSVTDTGIGIPEEKQSGVFSEFFQVDLTTTREYGGTGLGLAICRNLAQLMGGSIGFRSKEGEGSAFYLNLPLEPDVVNPFVTVPKSSLAAITNPFGLTDASQEEAQPPNTVSTGPKDTAVAMSQRVLVAEDSEVNRFIIKELLATMGITPVIVNDGAAAVTAFEQGEYDLILMDIQMPVMDGMEATDRILSMQKASGRNPSCKIIGLSAHAMAQDRERCLQLGMSDYLTKPIDKERLKGAIESSKPTKVSSYLWR